MALDALRAELDTALQRAVSYLPEIVAAVIVVLISLKLGGLAGRLAARLVERLGVSRVAEESRLGQAFKRAGLVLTDFVSALVKALVVIAGTMIALLTLDVGGQVGVYAWFIVNYAARLVGAVLLLVMGALLFEVLSSFLAGLFGASLTEEKRDLVGLIRDLFFIGLLAVLLSIVLNLLMLPGTLVYPLILGITAIVLGITLSDRLVDSIVEKHEDFRSVAGYAKFLLMLVFIIVGIAGIFGPVAQTSQVIANLAWGIAIAAALLLVPIMYALARRMTGQKGGVESSREVSSS